MKVGNGQTQRRDFSAMRHPFDNNQTTVELLSYDHVVLLISAQQWHHGHSLNQ
ncbi:hypothetical protein [Dechloromonas sp. H13]|uniref:hypothetical protein n=1 Tax=Dechloromonas sp. H13 TaxID=2570193 RepID=UPI001884D38E|nr:hypothetical protein [Dechloromonas sp. H13]